MRTGTRADVKSQTGIRQHAQPLSMFVWLVSFVHTRPVTRVTVIVVSPHSDVALSREPRVCYTTSSSFFLLSIK